MYDPAALVQTLETASMVEQNLLDALRGPDAAHRITDEQIHAITTSPLFAPRYGKPYYYDIFYAGDMDTFLFFCPYDSQHNDLTVGFAARVFVSHAEGDKQATMREAWLSVGDGEHISSRPLDYDTACDILQLEEAAEGDEYLDVRSFSEYSDDAGRWSDEYATALFYWKRLKGDMVTFAADGSPASEELTLKYVNAMLKQHYQGAIAPLSIEEYSARDADASNGSTGWTKTKRYDSIRRCVYSPEASPRSVCESVVSELTELGEPETSPLSKAAHAKAHSFLVEEIMKRAEKEPDPTRAKIQDIADSSDSYNWWVRKAAQKILEWDDARERKLAEIVTSPLPLNEIDLLWNKLSTFNPYYNFEALGWKEENGFDKLTGLWDENGEPCYLAADLSNIWSYLKTWTAVCVKNAQNKRWSEATEHVKATVGAATPSFWQNEVAEKPYWFHVKQALRNDTHIKQQFDKYDDLPRPIQEFLGEAEGYLQVWDERTMFHSTTDGTLPFAYFPDVSQGRVLRTREEDPERPVIAGEQRARLNSAHDTCRREMEAFYTLTTNKQYFGRVNNYSDDSYVVPQPLEFPEVADQLKKVLDAVEALAEVANGYSPAYIQIDDEGALHKRDKENALWEQVRRTVDAVSENYPSDKIVLAKHARKTPPQPRPFRGGFGTFNNGAHLLEEIKYLVKPGWSVIFKDEVAEMVWRDVTGYLELCYLRVSRCWDSANMSQYRGSYAKSYKQFVYSVNRAEDGSVAISYDLDRPLYVERGAPPRNYQYVSSDWMRPAARDFMEVAKEHLKKGDKEFYFVAGSDNTTRKALVDGQELVSTPLMPTDIWRYITEAEEKWLRVTPMKALPGQRGIVARAELLLQL